MVFNSMASAGYYAKRRPTFRRGDMAGFGGHAGVVFAAKPRKYPLTAQQVKVKDVAEKCGIRRGISRPALIAAMKDCVSREMRKGGGGYFQKG